MFFLVTAMYNNSPPDPASASKFHSDFLIIERHTGKDAEKLLLVQASATKYMNHTGPTLTEVYKESEILEGNSALAFYSEKTGISADKCYLQMIKCIF